LCMLFVASQIVYGVEQQQKCMHKFDLSMCYSTEPMKYHLHTCHENNVCKKQFNISYVRLEPYTTGIVVDLLYTCCGKCTKFAEVKTYDDVSQVPAPTNTTSHFIFPVLGRSAAVKLYGYHFLPLVQTPSVYYITPKVTNILNILVEECLNMWPLLINCMLMILLSGFVGWLLEQRDNQEFPKQFFKGWFEGIWWSFVSMTTVGYGDKVPKSYPGRLFTMVWILVGMTTFSFLTAMMSSELTKINSLPPPTISGAKVGALRHRVYDALFIANHGGILIDINAGNSSNLGVHHLIKKLKNKEIDGFVVDRYTLFMLFGFAKRLDTYKRDADFIKEETLQTEISYTGEKLSYGALVKTADDYEFLSDFVTDNTNVMTTCNNLMVNNFSNYEIKNSMHRMDNLLFSESGEIFWSIFISVSACVGMIVCFGLIYEYLRWKNRTPKSVCYTLTSIQERE